MTIMMKTAEAKVMSPHTSAQLCWQQPKSVYFQQGRPHCNAILSLKTAEASKSVYFQQGGPHCNAILGL